MGYEGFSNDELRAVIVQWAKDAPDAGSRGVHAQEQAIAELARRRWAHSSVPLAEGDPAS